MTSRLIIFFFLTGWAYMALVLLYRNGRASIGRALQGIALAVLTGVVLLFFDNAVAALGGLAEWFGLPPEAFGPPALAVAFAVLFVVMGFFPPVLRRRAMRLSAFGRERAALRLNRLADVISWQPMAKEARALHTARRLMMKGRHEEARDVLDDALERSRPGAAWGQLAVQEIEIHAALRDWREAKASFERLRRECPAQVTPEALYVATRAFLETGEPLEAVRCVEEAEAQRERTAPADMQRFMAFVAVFAMMGQSDLLRGLFDDSSGLADRLPPAIPPYWMGVARAAAGDAEGARELFDLALSRLDWEQVAWRVAIQGRMKEAEVFARPSEEARSAARSLWPLWKQDPPVHPLTYGRAIPWFTVALIVLNVAAWALVELWPAGPLRENLVMFGANVPQWVKRGQFWRLGACMFLHAGMLHLLLNMYALYMFGGFVERMAGRGAALFAYIAGGVAASAATAFLSPYPISVGASGAVLALLGAALVFLIRRCNLLPARARRLYIVNYGFLVVMSVAVGWFVPGVDNYAHSGGTVGGLLLGFFAVPKAGKRRARAWIEGCLAAAAGALLFLWLVQAGRNVAGGGYPDSVPMVRREFPRVGVSAELPMLWERRDIGAETVYVNAIVDRDHNAMHPDMLKYLDAIEIRKADGEPEEPEDDEELGEEMPPLKEGRGLVETAYGMTVDGQAYRVVFLAGSEKAAGARRDLYRRILDSVR